MSITTNDWNIIKPLLVEGCTWTQIATDRSRTVTGTYYKDSQTNYQHPTFNNNSWNTSWSILCYGHTVLKQMSDFRFPDGTPMIGKDTTSYSPVLHKIKKLEQQYNNRLGGKYAMLCM